MRTSILIFAHKEVPAELIKIDLKSVQRAQVVAIDILHSSDEFSSHSATHFKRTLDRFFKEELFLNSYFFDAQMTELLTFHWSLLLFISIIH